MGELSPGGLLVVACVLGVVGGVGGLTCPCLGDGWFNETAGLPALLALSALVGLLVVQVALGLIAS